MIQPTHEPGLEPLPTAKKTVESPIKQALFERERCLKIIDAIYFQKRDPLEFSLKEDIPYIQVGQTMRQFGSILNLELRVNLGMIKLYTEEEWEALSKIG